MGQKWLKQNRVDFAIIFLELEYAANYGWQITAFGLRAQLRIIERIRS